MQFKETPEDFIVDEIPSRKWEESGRYHVYKVKKRDATTLYMLRLLAQENKISQKEFGYAGLKDRQAVTTQFITSPRELTSSDFTLTHVGYTDEPLRLGDLKGNAFEIVIKDVTEVRDVLIPNYYGDQRFSKNNVSRGLLLLKKQYKELAQDLAEDFPKVKEFLAEKPNEYVPAIQKVPFNILLIYMHSVQSWLWNEVVSNYIKENFDCVEAPYARGILRFPHEIEQQEVPVIGCVQDLGNWEHYYTPLLEEAEIDQTMFRQTAIASLTQEGTTRTLLTDIQAKTITRKGDDAVLFLELGKGSYATICIQGWFA